MSLFPKPLKSKSTIGLICPAGGFVDYKTIKLVIDYLRKSGYRVKVGKSLICSTNHYKYLSGTDKNRLSDLTDFFNDKDVDAIFCLRGGYGTLRLLNHIDFNSIKRSKKIFMGFSDITVLLLAIFSQCDLVTFHGPLLGINFLNKNLMPKDKSSGNYIWKMLLDSRFKYSYSDKSNAFVIYPGKAKGKLLGGNLTDLCSMLGSKYLPDFKSAILFLEDVYEEPYKIDRLLTQLRNAGILKSVNGLIFGSFKKCKFNSHNEVIDLIKDRVKEYKVPTIYNFPVGHSLKNYILPIGTEAILNADNLILHSV